MKILVENLNFFIFYFFFKKKKKKRKEEEENYTLPPKLLKFAMSSSPTLSIFVLINVPSLIGFIDPLPPEKKKKICINKKVLKKNETNKKKVKK
jgi:hypothetical protein